MIGIRQGAQAELWQSLIAESASRQRVALDVHEESYLGFVLMQHMRDASIASRIMALDLLHAAEQSGAVRVDALRDVGDRCLLIAGLYPHTAQRRRVTPDYFIALGRDAYGGVAQSARAGYASLFAQLAHAFERLVQVLRAMRFDTRITPEAAARTLSPNRPRIADPHLH